MVTSIKESDGYVHSVTLIVNIDYWSKMMFDPHREINWEPTTLTLS